MKKIIMLNGPPGSGKSEVAQFLVDGFGFAEHRLAKPLVDTAQIFFEFDNVNEFKKLEIADNFNGRDFLIGFAEHFLKPAFGKNFLACTLVKKLTDPMYHYTTRNMNIVISDIGFYDEISLLLTEYRTFLEKMETPHQFELWHIDRPDCDFNHDSRSYVYSLTTKTRVIQNNGELNDLYAKVREFVNE